MVDRPKGKPAERPVTRSGPGPAVTLRIGLYILAALAAGATLFVAPALNAAVTRGALSEFWLKVPLAIYGLFVVVYGVDRFWLVRRRRYPAGKALFQVGFAAIFFLVLPNAIHRTPHSSAENRPTSPKASDYSALEDSRPEVRQNFVFAMGYHGVSKARVDSLVLLLDDPDSGVRAAAAKVLSDWSGKPIEQISGIRVWASALSMTSTKSGRERNE